MRSPLHMKAKSELLADRRRNSERSVTRKKNGRIPLRERRELILVQAGEFFAEYGLTAQTRALADACGISQRRPCCLLCSDQCVRAGHCS